MSSGSVEKLTAGNRSSAPLLRRARAQEPRWKRSPSMSSQRTVWLPSSVRTVTPRSSATVRNRTIIADSTTGMINSGADGGHSITGISKPRARNPTARCAMGDSLITRGVREDEPVATRPSFHPGRPADPASGQAAARAQPGW
ncbi:hypothetical protein I550_3913 [Mycobacterium intracellulare 1956]|uniref:Uncharacterized protein n=1 Tax=Mycobacterium intracellulare 1956 TaxID=1299331 RepID=X8CIV9_MYCIT|nr:hypothetical protein I550_3913 [Mycobacterium intracellulare 1956]